MPQPGAFSRARILGVAAAAFLSLLLLAGGCARRSAPPARRALARNFVLLCFDTVRADSFARHDRPGSPDAFSSWSRRAVVYDDARAAAPWTLPSVASVMSGLYPAHHNAGRFVEPIADLGSRVPSRLPARVPVLGSAASREGFQTAAFITNAWVGVETGVLRGFRTVEMTPHRKVLAAALGWLENARRADSPFFLYVHWVDAHGNSTADRKKLEAAALSPEERRELVAGAPGGTCNDPGSRPCIRFLSYHREVEIQRHDAAELLNHLEAHDLLRDTLVVLFSDHGEEFGEHRKEERLRGVDPRGIYGAGHGHALYDEVLRVPLLVWSPGERPRHDASPVSLVDIAATARQRLGLPARRMDGRPLPLGGGFPPDRAVFASGIAYGPEQAAVVTRGRKEIAISCPEQALLFDERSDPGEKNPARGRAADPALEGVLVRYLGERSAEVQPMKLASSRLEALRSLGYLRGPIGAGRPAAARAEPMSFGVYDRKTATFYLRVSNSPGEPDRVQPFGKPGDLPVVGDWDGDGTTDLGVYRRSTRTFYLESRDGGIQTISAAALPAARVETPRAGDWDGDGVDSVALYQPARKSLRWMTANRSGAGWEVIPGGAPGELAVSGKWRCSGRSRLAFFLRDRGIFHFEDPNVAADVPFGLPGDVPIAGDWDGDGTVTIGVYRPATSTFLLRNALSPGSPDAVVSFGPPGSIPVVGRWGAAPPAAAMCAAPDRGLAPAAKTILSAPRAR